MPQTAPLLRSRLRDAAADVMLRAAEQVMGRKGFHGATMQDIAAAAGCAVGTLYVHFKNKEQLLGGIILKYGASLAEDIRAAVQSSADPLAKLRFFVSAHLEWVHRHPTISELVGKSLPTRYYDFKASLRKLVPAEHGEMQNLELQLVREAQNAGIIRRDIPAETLAELVDGFMFTVIDQFSARPQALSLPQQIEYCWGFLTTGLQACCQTRKTSQPKKRHA
jgi:TetR/AcrR family fatty acid metabolism transcriptional regulator